MVNHESRDLVPRLYRTLTATDEYRMDWSAMNHNQEWWRRGKKLCQNRCSSKRVQIMCIDLMISAFHLLNFQYSHAAAGRTKTSTNGPKRKAKLRKFRSVGKQWKTLTREHTHTHTSTNCEQNDRTGGNDLVEYAATTCTSKSVHRKANETQLNIASSENDTESRTQRPATATYQRNALTCQLHFSVAAPSVSSSTLLHRHEHAMIFKRVCVWSWVGWLAGWLVRWFGLADLSSLCTSSLTIIVSRNEPNAYYSRHKHTERLRATVWNNKQFFYYMFFLSRFISFRIFINLCSNTRSTTIVVTEFIHNIQQKIVFCGGSRALARLRIHK